MSIQTANKSTTSFSAIIAFAGLWSLAMGSSAFFALLNFGWAVTPHMIPVVLLFVLAGLPAGFLGWITAAYITAKAGPGPKFSAMVVFLMFWTILLTALLFSLQYRQYFAQSHFPALTIVWAFQYIFTGFASLYLFAVQGTRMFLPLGTIALFCAGIAFARWSR